MPGNVDFLNLSEKQPKQRTYFLIVTHITIIKSQAGIFERRPRFLFIAINI